ncbi:MAG: hypothetical protein Q8922_04675 [Bacteroidota bacterium]|nr:hypothetical protein [Bacteroidota bacterium]MDP4231876.1 hypothetical protein [Bacteroidota bacterium]MDP4242762.1 hypothetical protein [Bacteroidota bacterium]MDP4287213.1 hypothetical protein [Bacteroidota bacterium]
MPTYPSPVLLVEFQEYIKDASTDAALLLFYQSLLDTATESVYTWLDRDYTPAAPKTDTFFGDDTQCYAPRNRVGTLLTWSATDAAGTTTIYGTGELLLRANGYLIQIASTSVKTFQSGYEHALTYQQPSAIQCPETIKQVITEIATLAFQASNQGQGTLALASSSERQGALGFSGGFSDREKFLDLTERHREMLRPYKRYPI